MIEIEQGTGKYVTIAADEETALRWSRDIGFKMMQYNQIRGVLPISQQYIDERLHVYYEVNKMQTLESMYAEAGLSVDKALKILLSLLQTVQGAEQYFLSAEQFVLNEQMVFSSRDNSRIWLCYHPDHDVEIAEGVRAVMEFLMKRILHSNRTATASFYGLYDMVCERRCTMAELAEHIIRQQSVSQEQTKQPKDVSRTLQPKTDSKLQLSLHGKRDLPQQTLQSICVPAVISLLKSEVHIGRLQTEDVCIPIDYISREHAVLYIDDDQIQIEDCDSANGTFLNGEQLMPHVRTTCNPGDLISFSDITYDIC